ncbi:MAG: hypothetical protein ACI8VE_000161 [Natrialbaceae archaeon]|jgi:hypothetical protein
MTDSESRSSGRQTKVARLIDEYDLDGLGAELEHRWTAEGDERMSLRALATHFNQQLLEVRMTGAGIQSLSGEVENTYRLLTDDEVSGADRTRTVRRLEGEGIDTDALRDDFVTYQAIRSYLKGNRDAEYVKPNKDRIESELANVQRLRGRVMTVTEGNLEQLRQNGEITLGEFGLLVGIAVLCETCGQRYEVEELLEQGGCDCEESYQSGE